jgi:diazepam-binding inhibitor (GABA receptor modulator, acyl-CoA-binding protein)
MSKLQEQFAQAQVEVNQLPTRPNNETLLKLYAFYKQATEGDVHGDRPGGFDLVKIAKHDAWSKIKGTSGEAAMQQYIDLVGALRRPK